MPPAMPLKFNNNRSKRFRAQYRIRNWPQYDAGLRQRGDLTLWLDEAAIAGWSAPRRATPGGQARYSNFAIELVLMLRLVYHLALRQAEGFVSSIFRLLGLALPIPDHTTLSRRGRDFVHRRPHPVPHGPLHLLIEVSGEHHGADFINDPYHDARSPSRHTSREAIIYCICRI